MGTVREYRQQFETFIHLSGCTEAYAGGPIREWAGSYDTSRANCEQAKWIEPSHLDGPANRKQKSNPKTSQGINVWGKQGGGGGGLGVM